MSMPTAHRLPRMSASAKPSRYAGTPNRPVFMGGCPRSGTTLIRTMLNSHPDLAMPHETRFLIDAYRRRRKWGDMSDPERRRELARWIVRQPKTRVQRLTKDFDAFVERSVAAPPTIGAVLSTGFTMYAERHGKRRWGDKRPSYILELDAVMAMFPNAQFINVVRDPRAAVASIRKIGWFADGLSAGTALWLRSQRSADRWRRKLGPDQFLEIRYEQLVEDTEGTLSRLVEFLGLDPGGLESMLSYHEKIDIMSRQIHPLLDKPVTAAAVRSWETALERPEIGLIETTLADRMARYGYEPVAAGVPIPAELTGALRDRQRRWRREDRQRRRAQLRCRLLYRHGVAASVPNTRSTTRVPAPPA